jgi:hypothetical protein
VSASRTLCPFSLLKLGRPHYVGPAVPCPSNQLYYWTVSTVRSQQYESSIGARAIPGSLWPSVTSHRRCPFVQCGLLAFHTLAVVLPGRSTYRRRRQGVGKQSVLLRDALSLSVKRECEAKQLPTGAARSPRLVAGGWIRSGVPFLPFLDPGSNRGSGVANRRSERDSLAATKAIWLILPVVICLSQRLSHACLSINFYTVKLRMAH